MAEFTENKRARIISKKLLCISDFEGCVKTSASGQPQSRLLCTNEFFDAVIAFLKLDTENKVAFLGDYFDQGDLVVDTINNIIRVYKKFEDRVYIILGNRDLNKLRLIFEMREAPQVLDNEANGWPVWKGFYTDMASSPSLNARLLSIVNKSMGAAGDIKIAVGLSAEESAYVLVRAFSQQNAGLLTTIDAAKKSELDSTFADFFTNVRTLFTVGKIVIYDAVFKALLSHAGGIDPFMFHNKTYYDKITENLTPEPSYYGKIEKVRKELQIPPTGTEIEPTFVAETYNSVLSVIPELFDSPPVEPPSEYYLIQGLGLKPDNNIDAVFTGKTFTSFVQSCDVQGCRGPYGHDIHSGIQESDKALYNSYLEKLKAQGIEKIVHGHAPHCAPIPLIYKREGVEGLVFVDNDTSNGYRPAAIIAIDQIPLAYVSTDGKAGVFSLPGNTTNTYKGDANVFASMVGEWDAANAPTFGNDSKVITYADGKTLTFPARAHTRIPGIFSPAAMVGGKRRKNTHKIRNRRRGGATKKNRKSKRRVR